MTEYDEAIKIANKILDRHNADPNDDIAIVSRQFLRTKAENRVLKNLLMNAEDALDGALVAIRGPYGQN